MPEMGATRHAPWGVTDSIASCSCRGGRAWGPQRGLMAQLAVTIEEKPSARNPSRTQWLSLAWSGLNVSVDDSS